MPRYFFNLVMGKVVHYDRKGSDLEGAEAARQFALQSARDLTMRRLTHKALPSECSIEVADESGNVLLTVPFSEVRL
jgi:hypothetical protein